MPPIPLADNFLAGSLLSLLLPVGLLIAIVIWFVFVVKRLPATGARAAAAPPSAPDAHPDSGGAPAEASPSEP
jgi:hypothetical protein